MKKKFFAVALTATMTLSTVMTASAATVDVDITGGLGSAFTGDETVTGDFDVTYTFNNASHDTSANWNNFAVEVYGDGFGITARADAFAVGYNGAEAVLGGWGDNPIAPTTTWTGLPEDWAVWAAGMGNADVTVNVKRSANVLTLTYEMKIGDIDYKIVGTTPEVEMPESLNIHLTGEKVNLTNVKFTDNKAVTPDQPTTEETTTVEETTTAQEATTVEETTVEETTVAQETTTVQDTTVAQETTTAKTDAPKTGDSSTIMMLGAVAVIACAGVVVSRKKFQV